MRREKKLGVVGYILVAEIVGALAGLLSGDIGGTYRSLNQPFLSPPGWVFPVVWVILYACMGIAAWMVASSTHVRPEERGQAMVLYWAQLLVNFCWPIVFFRFEWFFVALVILVLLDLLVVLTIRCFSAVRPEAALLLIPYLAWLLFATYLNVGVWLLN